MPKEEIKKATVQELRKLREKEREIVGGFRAFVNDYNVAPLAIGVVIGGAVNEFVRVLVDGLIYPIISLLSFDGRLQNLQVVFRGSTFKLGAVFNSLVSFLSVCIIVYFFIKLILRNDKILKKS